MDLLHITPDQLIKAYQKRKFKLFDITKPLNLNIFGIRAVSERQNTFDDVIGIYYSDRKGLTYLRLWMVTTQPGEYWLEHPMNKKGTGILVSDQYLGVYELDLHHGEYLALCQRGNMTVWRDNDRDNIPETDGTMETGIFGVNIHRATAKGTSVKVDKWSAACQVFASANDFDEFIAICEASKKIYGNKFSYTLFNEEDFK